MTRTSSSGARRCGQVAAASSGLGPGVCPIAHAHAVADSIAQRWPLAKAGQRVGGARWPLSSAHPDCWGEPLTGVVLDIDDPQAWAQTVAFSDTPEVQAVRRHLLSVALPGGWTTVPVAWATPTNPRLVRWSRATDLRTPEDDRRLWSHARAKAYLAC